MIGQPPFLRIMFQEAAMRKGDVNRFRGVLEAEVIEFGRSVRRRDAPSSSKTGEMSLTGFLPPGSVNWPCGIWRLNRPNCAAAVMP